MAIAPQITQAQDDVAPATGTVYYGDYTNDTAPLVRVSLGDQALAGQTLQLSDNGQAIGQAVTLTAAQLSQGYADVPVSGLSNDWHLLAATLKGADGTTVATSASFALGVATQLPAAPVITSADDDAGASTGVLQDGARTDDATPTFHITEAGLPPPPTGSPGHAPYGGPALLSGHVELYENGQVVGDAMLGYGGAVTITPGTLSDGDHVLTAVAVDRAGNVSAASQPFHLTIGADLSATSSTSTDAPTDPVDTVPTTSGPAAAASGDVLIATAAAPQIIAGTGNDTLTGIDSADMLRGGGGNDSITGGLAYNEINGNQGQDTIIGRSHVGDSLMGGQGNDLIDATASTGHDSINGNMGDDVIHAGSGGSTLWGGQGDDVIIGGLGSDWLSGDRGNNTLTGGGGADVFHGFAAGNSLVTDFNAAQGDRVEIDAGVTYQVSQHGADTVIDMAGGGQLVLAGVNAASLSSGWIFQG